MSDYNIWGSFVPLYDDIVSENHGAQLTCYGRHRILPVMLFFCGRAVLSPRCPPGLTFIVPACPSQGGHVIQAWPNMEPYLSVHNDKFQSTTSLSVRCSGSKELFLCVKDNDLETMEDWTPNGHFSASWKEKAWNFSAWQRTELNAVGKEVWYFLSTWIKRYFNPLDEPINYCCFLFYVVVWSAWSLVPSTYNGKSPG